MKTKLITGIGAVMLLALACFLLPSFTGAAPAKHTDPELKKMAPGIPCGGPYSIINNSACDLTIKYTLLCGGVPCASFGPIVLSTGATYVVPPAAFACLSSCTAGCDIKVSAFWLGNLLGSVSSTNQFTNWAIPACVPTGSIKWTNSATTIF